ncbi:hypothetical protein [Herbidospora mongoliensis]|uniref:hypothetical protein n=1 Tax=Herbidospora mongoliensis TaxID=688067 RepID=UPI000B1A3A22|nr:hypothetical protein [Herbidospora mongoliensis]
MSELVLALVAGFMVAALGTPVGVSGAVFLLPPQSSLLGVTGPAITLFQRHIHPVGPD